MGKLVKYVSTCLAAAVVAASAVSVIPTIPAAALSAGGMTLNSKDFRPVFDYDTYPGTYPVGTKAGTTSDPICITANKRAISGTGLGMTYDLTVVAGKSIAGNALQLSVSDFAPENGAYCPVAWFPQFGKNPVTDVKGATDFMFWVDTTNFKNAKTGKCVVKAFNMFIQEMNVTNGKIDRLKGTGSTAWAPTSAEKGGIMYIEKSGQWVSTPLGAAKNHQENCILLPVNYKGWIRLPLSKLERIWADDPNQAKYMNTSFQGLGLYMINFGMGNYAANIGSTVIFDEMGFYSSTNAFATVPLNDPSYGLSYGSTAIPSSTGGTSTTTTTANGKSSVTASNAVGTSTTGSSGTALSSAASGAASSALGSSVSSALASSMDNISSSTDSSGSSASNTSGKPAATNHMLLIILILVVVLAAAGVGGFLLYTKVLKK